MVLSVAQQLYSDLEVPQKVSEVNMEQLASLSDHDVVRVTIANPQDVGSNTVTSTREEERLRCLLEPGGDQENTCSTTYWL